MAVVLPHLLSRWGHKIYFNLWEVYLHSMLYGNLPFSELKIFVNLWENKTRRYTQLYLQQQHCVGYFMFSYTSKGSICIQRGQFPLLYHQAMACFSPVFRSTLALPWFSTGPSAFFHPLWRQFSLYGNAALVEKCRIRYHKQWGCYSPMLDWMSQAEEMLFSSVGLSTYMAGGGEIKIHLEDWQSVYNKQDVTNFVSLVQERQNLRRPVCFLLKRRLL